MRIVAGLMMEVIYEDRSGRMSKRCVRVIRVQADRLIVYCFTRKAVRTLRKDNILALQPFFNGSFFNQTS